jgi:hypothetical protein
MKRTKKRNWSWWVVGTIGTVVILLAVSQPLLGTFVQRKLVSTVEERTNATLQVGSVTYLPPYGIRVTDAEFTVPDAAAPSGRVEMLKVKRLELRLAKLPLRPGPLVIERVLIESPEVRLVKTDKGLLGLDGIVKPEDRDEQKIKKKLSEVFELRRLTIEDGSVVYEDRTEPDAVPVAWRDLNVSTETRPTSGAIYAYDFSGQQGELASVKSSGTFDIDNLILDAKSLALNVRVDRDATESTVPAPVQKLLAKYAVEGKLGVAGRGRVPLKELGKAEYQFDLALDDGRGRVPKVGQPIDALAARVRVTGRAGEPVSTLLALEAVSGPNVLHVDDGEVLVDVAKGEWDVRRLGARVDASAVGVRPFQMPASAPAAQKKLRAGGVLELTAAGTGPLEFKSLADFRERVRFEVVATANDFHAQPPGFDVPVRLVTGAPIVANQDGIRVSNVTGRYGYDQFQVTTLWVPFRDLPRVLRVEQITATATFDRNTPGYPGKLGEWRERVNPLGPFHIGGTASYDRERTPKLDYHLLVHSDRGAVELVHEDRRIMVTRIQADGVVDPGVARLDYCEANVFGGVVSATGEARFGKGQLDWSAAGTVKDFDLRTAVQALTGKEMDTEKLAGQVFLRFDMAGGKTPESVKGTGEARLFNGRLFEVPVLSDVLDRAGLGKGLTGSEAAATFAVADSRVLVRRAALGSPAIGVQGHGTVGFDQSLDMRIIVAPLGQWMDRLKQTGVPFVSKALGQVAGAVQGVVNAAASTLLYEFHVTGTGREPKIRPVPAPILSKGAAAIFGKMMGAGEKAEETLAEEMKRIEEEEGK